VGTFERWFIEANKWALVVLLAAMSVIVFTNVSLRYLTNASITWAEEVARYLMIWMTFIGAGLVLRFGGHVAVTNLQDMAPVSMQRILRLGVAALMMLFCAIFVWMSAEYAWRMRFQLTPATRVPFSYVYAAMPIGFALLVVHLLLVARSFVRDNRFEALEAETGASGLAIE
jgi:TRAP-type C4-dicarboxylate transport system permease small subunit